MTNNLVSAVISIKMIDSTYLLVIDCLRVYWYTNCIYRAILHFLICLRISSSLLFLLGSLSSTQHEVSILSQNLLFDLIPLIFFHFVVGIKFEKVQVFF